MFRSLGFAAALACAAPTALVPAVAHAGDRTLPMHFDLRMQGPADLCGSQCARWIFASGAITADTPKDFKQFVFGRNVADVTIVLDSDGGSVLGAIALGREIRSLKLATTVGRLVEVKSAPVTGSKDGARFIDGETPRAALLPRADCESMCAFVLLAGVKRTVPAEARVMVHQIWLGDRREDPTAATYSAEDLVLVQRDIGRLAQYTFEMGATADLLDLALRIPPWEPMHAMTREELQRTRLMTDEPVAVPATTAVATPPAPAVLPAQRLTDGVRASPISERRWVMVDRAGVTSLARHHPLTAEGDDIGSFDLLLTCGGNAESYDLTYVERRRSSDETPLPDRLTGVTLRVGAALTPLKLAASERNADTGELLSFAAGPVPANLVGAFTGAGNRSMVIETQSEGMVTVIRLGNTGVQQTFPRLAASCAKPGSNQAALPARNAGGYAAAQ